MNAEQTISETEHLRLQVALDVALQTLAQIASTPRNKGARRNAKATLFFFLGEDERPRLFFPGQICVCQFFLGASAATTSKTLPSHLMQNGHAPRYCSIRCTFAPGCKLAIKPWFMFSPASVIAMRRQSHKGRCFAPQGGVLRESAGPFDKDPA